MAKRAAAEVGDFHEVNRDIRERLSRIETSLGFMCWTLEIAATGSLATAAGVFTLVYKALA